jgi:hypothetical protein
MESRCHLWLNSQYIMESTWSPLKSMCNYRVHLESTWNLWDRVNDTDRLSPQWLKNVQIERWFWQSHTLMLEMMLYFV